jgi:putative ABC transport system permease protein
MSRRDRDLEDEIRQHLRMAAEDRGEDAARREFGNVGLIKEVTREMWGWTSLDKLTQDVRYAFRGMRRSPGFTLTAVLSLALGIGANTAIFSLIDAVMLKYLPVSHPEQLVQLGEGDRTTWTNPIWELVRDRQDAFSGVFAYSSWRFNLASGGEEHNINGTSASGDYFSTLGVRAVLGRAFTRDDDRRGCPGIAVLSYDFWQRQYGGSPDVLGRTVSLDNHPFQIVGVIAPGFHGTDVGNAQDVYVPLCTDKITRGEYSGLDRRAWWWLSVIGRPKPGVSVQQATARLQILAPGIFADTVPESFGADYRARYLRRTLDIIPAATGLSYLRTKYRSALLTLMIVVVVVLMIACANVANLLLARATVRRKEIAVRLALGAGRARVIRQLLTESILLSAIGAALGVLFAKSGTALILQFLSTRNGPVSLDLAPDLRVLAFTIAVTVATGLLFGLAPAWRGTRVSPQAAMKENSRAATQGRSSLGLGNVLMMGQVALSLVLVVAAGLLVGTFRKLETLNPGFNRDHVLLMTVDLRNTKYPKERLAEAYRDIADRLRVTPGVRVVSTSTMVPIGGNLLNDNIHVEGFTPKSEDDSTVCFNQVSAGYFETMGTKLTAGRDFNDHDTPTSPKVAIVNESMAKKFFGSVDVVGKVFRIVGLDQKLGPPVEIVGVVQDAKYKSLRDADMPTVYPPISQDRDLFTFNNYELRAAGAAAGLIPSLKSAMQQFNPDVVLTFGTMQAQVDESLIRERLLATLSGFFGALALMLSAIGLYGVMSYSVAGRRNEIGIRMALGAEQRRILRMVLGDVAVLVAVGLTAGVAAAFVATRLVASFLYEVTPRDPVTIGVSAVVLAAVASVAGYLPARRASRLDPMTALREE